MPLTHARTFRVRHYECDAFGHVNHANYLRYMQEAAFDASAAAGFDANRYRIMDRHWLIRETDIEYLRPLRYGDSVRVKTWVVDFHRARSRRAYEFLHAEADELVARAQTDWVFFDTTAGRPARIPLSVRSAFLPEGASDSVPPRARFPSTPPPPAGTFSMQRRVEWRDLDQVGHVNNAVHLAYIEDCGLQMLEAHGWPLPRMAAQGFSVVARRHRIEYRQPAVLGDKLDLATWISDVQHTTAVRHSTIARADDGTLLVRVRTLHGWLDVGTGQSVPIPDALSVDLGPIIAGIERKG